MKETTKNNWKKYWEKRKNKGVKSWLPKLQQFLLRKFIDQRFIDVAINNSRKGKIVEVGSGLGFDSIAISQKRGDKVILIDFYRGVLKEAKVLALQQKVEIQTIETDIRKKLPLKNKSATLAWNVGTLEHFEHPVNIVKEMRRISKCVICIVPMKHPLRLIYEKIRNFFHLGAEGYFVLYSPDDLRGIFKEAGFKKIKKVKFIHLLGFISFCGAIGTD